ncbi:MULTISPECIES: hypothetical protein [Actinoalloteichus]|uniref:Uncharacterized protein n=1 Tax=Actinoalloteichus fjordicus TaxID=1612552 RepID=A0AAC9LHI6_9PSEU|nr:MULTISPECIES: hypothetical protein [Actinoalloteichus]APU16424.1 hypothetical protein UA74_22030 [Actinoalloteichus fjordicus]APU22482.1 hypothetical protein UA75_22500 [Actinoalloteichus sp. GBA129-24]
MSGGSGSPGAVGAGTPGERRRLRPFRRRELLHRWLYTLTHHGPDGPGHVWTVDVDMTDEEWAAELYLDGERQQRSEMPAAFPVPGGTIEVNASLYGITRMHLVHEDGREERLAPVRGTAEDLRGRLARRHPGLSRSIGRLAIGILIVNLLLAVPQALEIATRIPRIAENLGTFTSPIMLPAWLNITLLVAGVLAAVERILTLRHHRLLDVETIWSGF